MEAVKKFLEADQFARHNGIELVDVTPGAAKARMVVKEHHLNGYRSVQGGAIFTLADFAFALACNSGGTVSVAINVSISFVKAAGAGDTLTADAREIARSPKISTCTVHVTNQAGDLIAVFQGLAYCKKETVADAVARIKP
jgi:acyl-CoA thioesterase